jgi:prevent-host-death family protein
MVIGSGNMATRTISVSEFRQRCLDVIRRVEKEGTPVDLTRRGKVVARLVPSTPAPEGTPPWLRLRGTGTLHAGPEESALDAAEFDALRDTGT